MSHNSRSRSRSRGEMVNLSEAPAEQAAAPAAAAHPTPPAAEAAPTAAETHAARSLLGAITDSHHAMTVAVEGLQHISEQLGKQWNTWMRAKPMTTL